MTLSEVVRTAVADALAVDLGSEWTAGQSNRVDYCGTSPTHGDNAEFVGARMNEWAERTGRGIRYQAVSFDFEPPKGDSDPHLSDAHAKQIHDQICRQLGGER